MRDESGLRDRDRDRNSDRDTGPVAGRELWARLRRSVWQPPRPHGEQPRERVVGPLELFYDLAVVVLVAQAAHRLAGHLGWAGLGRPGPQRTASVQWIVGHLPLTAAVAAMGAAMLSLVDHAHDGRTPAATAWMLGAGAAVVLCATMLIAASLQAWDRDRGLYRPLARVCAVVAVACLGVGAARPDPLLLGLALVVLLSIPWVYAVARRLAVGDGEVEQQG
jgi:low temperature requirement protein LtrA